MLNLTYEIHFAKNGNEIRTVIFFFPGFVLSWGTNLPKRYYVGTTINNNETQMYLYPKSKKG